MTPDELRAERKRLGLSQPKLAAALGISVRTLQDWEQGRRVPRMMLLIERAIAQLEKEYANEVMR
jgi:DNA-binding transcriptional regulator YiaG